LPAERVRFNTRSSETYGGVAGNLVARKIALRLASRRGDGVDVDAATVAVEADVTFGQGKQGPVAADADIAAGEETRAALADDDAAGGDEFAAKSFHAEPFTDAVASVT